MTEGRQAAGPVATAAGGEGTERTASRLGAVALVAAAGSGERLGMGPKAFVEIGGRTLLEWTVEALRGHVDALVVAVAAGDVARARALLSGVRVVAGGASRQATVARLLGATDAAYVLVHDVARPFLPLPVLDRVAAAARATGAATAALPVPDTLVHFDTGEPVPRERLWAVQTPQGFRRELLAEAHAAALRDGVRATDDAGLVRRLGYEVTLVEGSPLLHKLTITADLALAGALLRAWRDSLATGR